MTPPPGGVVAAGTKAAEVVGKAATRAPRVALLVVGGLGALALVLGFAYLLVTRPAAAQVPLQTTGDWLTRAQFEAALTERDKHLSPATNEAISSIRSTLEGIRSDARAEATIREERSKAVLEVLGRVETNVAEQRARTDRLYERLVPTGK